MKKEELVELGLSEELAEKVLGKYGDMIPKSRFDEVNERMKTAEANVKERDKQIETLKKSATDNEGLQKQITELQAQNKANAEKYEADIKERSRNNSINLALTGKKARNLNAVRSLMQFEDSDFDENNELSKSGIAKIEKAFTENGWAFEVEAKPNDTKADFKGITPVNNNPNDKGGNPVSVGAKSAKSFLAQFQPNNNQ